MSEANVMTPKPPICTEKMSTAWPKADQCVVELTMEMPHVEIAEIAVKNAVVNVVVSSFGVAMGVISNVVDNAASVRKVEDGQTAWMVDESAREAALAWLAVFRHGLLESISREPPCVAM